MSGFLGRMFDALAGEEQQNAGAVHGALGDVLGINQPGGLSGLMEQFAANGMADHIRSWIGTGENFPITAEQVEQVLSNEQVEALVQRTGIPAEALMPMVAKILPHAVDHATPNGTTPGGIPADGATADGTAPAAG